MFEDSTFASTGRIRLRSRVGIASAMLFDTAIVMALVFIPLLHPRMLPHVMSAILMSVPPVPVEPEKPQPRTMTRVIPAVLNLNPFQAPRQIPKFIDYSKGPEPSIATSIADLADAGGPVGSNSLFDSGKPVTVIRAQDQHPMRVSGLVVEGLLVQKTIPGYPPIARATRTQGTVVLQATISSTGTIENLRVVSGSPMLQRAALDAVSTWRYRPYMLNGQPIAVETTINVVFKLDV